ncbi:BQ2448_6256 [Microbotryum intermedium]|uniref:60S ribosomal protein L6 n=1 Tax=Microbotryum intermedium TaxID=269621 RepID=A0A238FRU3_9BASI|nr:BQ2448_6256 [Microbotryum intermedium]
MMARNSDVSPYVGKFSRSQVYSKKGLYKREHKAAPAAAPPAPETKTKTVGGKANGSSRTIPTSRAAKFYPSEDVKQLKRSRKSVHAPKLRSSLTPGTVLILLAGRFRGKRVVLLKQLESGLLLVTGPFKVNGVPLRRVNQAYVIATSLKFDISSLTVDAKLNDAYFAKPKSASRNGTEGEFFADKAEKKAYPEDKVADQKTVDKAVLAAVNAKPNAGKYLAATFGLSKGQFPHLLKF